MTFEIRDRGRDAYIPTPEEEAELEASSAELERGEWIDGDEFLRDLRHRLANGPVSFRDWEQPRYDRFMTHVIRDRGRADEAEQYDLTEEQEAELEEAIAELERGEYVDWDDVREEFLRRHQ